VESRGRHKRHDGHGGQGDRLARFELPQLCLDLLDISSIPFSDPSLGTGAPHLGVADGHAPAVLVTVADREVWFVVLGNMSSVGTLSPNVRLILFNFLRFASASFF
jgi:hypothetical protein